MLSTLLNTFIFQLLEQYSVTASEGGDANHNRTSSESFPADEFHSYLDRGDVQNPWQQPTAVYKAMEGQWASHEVRGSPRGRMENGSSWSSDWSPGESSPGQHWSPGRALFGYRRPIGQLSAGQPQLIDRASIGHHRSLCWSFNSPNQQTEEMPVSRL